MNPAKILIVSPMKLDDPTEHTYQWANTNVNELKETILFATACCQNNHKIRELNEQIEDMNVDKLQYKIEDYE